MKDMAKGCWAKNLKTDGDQKKGGFMFPKRDLGLESQQRDEIKTNLYLKEGVRLLFSQTLDIKIGFRTL